MTTLRQIEANRRNALKSTGLTTAAGKQRSRCNAIRHGLTAETVIAVLENSEDYEAFEAACRWRSPAAAPVSGGLPGRAENCCTPAVITKPTLIVIW